MDGNGHFRAGRSLRGQGGQEDRAVTGHYARVYDGDRVRRSGRARIVRSYRLRHGMYVLNQHGDNATRSAILDESS